MVFASGYIEANELRDIDKITNSLRVRDIEVSDINGEKVVFLIERETPEEIRKELDSLKDIEGVRNAYLIYFTLGEDEEKAE